EIGLHAVLQEGARARPTQLVRDYRADEHVALEARARLYDGLHRADGGDHTALVIVSAHAPHPTVLVLRAVGIDGPAAHLHARIHVPVEHQARPAPGAGQR